MDLALTERPATEADVELLYQIRRAALGGWIEQAYGSWDDDAQRARFRELTRVADHRILEVGGDPIGCVSFHVASEELVLDRLFVLPAFQGMAARTPTISCPIGTVEQT